MRGQPVPDFASLHPGYDARFKNIGSPRLSE